MVPGNKWVNYLFLFKRAAKSNKTAKMHVNISYFTVFQQQNLIFVIFCIEYYA